MKTLILPIEKLSYFTEHPNNRHADYPGGNVVFPPVKEEVIRLKTATEGSFLLYIKTSPPFFFAESLLQKASLLVTGNLFSVKIKKGRDLFVISP